MPWTTTDLIASVKRRSAMPVAQASFTAPEVLAIANEEMGSYLIPLVLRQREDHWVYYQEQPLLDGVCTFPVPARSIGGKLREVQFLDAQRVPRSAPRLGPDDIATARLGFYVEGDGITVVAIARASIEKLRMSYYLRPSQLVETSAAAVISGLDATTVTLASVPAAFAGNDSWDLVSAHSPFAVRGADQPGVLLGSVITFTGGVPPNVLVGDYVCLPDQSPVPNVASELHGLLAQKVACRILSAKNMTDKMGPAEKELERLERDAVALIIPHIEGAALRLVVRDGLYRR